MKRLRATDPNGFRGLAVSGKPRGSAGMEMTGMAGEHYNVIAYGTGKRALFVRH